MELSGACVDPRGREGQAGALPLPDACCAPWRLGSSRGWAEEAAGRAAWREAGVARRSGTH
eukprot:6820877-Prymnesium_polylepis.1